MICHWRNADSSTLLSCMGLSPIYTEEQVSIYASQANGNGAKWGYWYALSCLRINRLIRPNTPEGPCGQTRGVPTGAQKTFAYIGLAASKDPEPISHAIIAGVAQIGAFFSNLFSGAPSALELQTQCDVVNSYNAFANSMEAALATGQITLDNAIKQLNVVHDQLAGMCRTVEGGQDSAPYGLRVALDALQAFNTEVIYPSHVQASTGASGVINKIGVPLSKGLSVITFGTVKVSSGIALVLMIILLGLGIGLVRRKV